MDTAAATTEMKAADAATTKMVARNVKIRANQMIVVGDKEVMAGDEVLATEDEAKEFCDRKFKGNFAFGGERSAEGGERERHIHARATRLGKN